MHTVGLPGSPVGIDQRDPTLAKLLKELGYRTGQFGKNHLGDRNEHLPTVNGFDEFYGNLYHLNTEEEPQLRMWPKDAGFDARYRPRGVLDTVATNVDDADRRRALRQGRQAEDRGHRAADHPAHGNGRRGVPRPHEEVHHRRDAGEAAVPRLVQPEPDAHLHAPEAGVAPPGERHLERVRHLRQRPDGARRPRGSIAEAARRAEDRRQHHRRLHHRQRGDGLMVARCAAPRRSAARRPPPGKAACACRCWCAGRRRSPRARSPTASRRTRTCSPRWPRPPVTATCRASSRRATRCASTASTTSRTGPAARPQRARSSTTTRAATSPPCASARGRRT